MESIFYSVTFVRVSEDRHRRPSWALCRCLFDLAFRALESPSYFWSHGCHLIKAIKGYRQRRGKWCAGVIYASDGVSDVMVREKRRPE